MYTELHVCWSSVLCLHCTMSRCSIGLPLMVLVVAKDGSRWIYLVHLPIYGWTGVSCDILWPWHQISDSFSLKAFSCCLNLILSLQLWKLLHTPWDVLQASWCNLIFSGFKCFIWLHLRVTCEMSGGCVLANLPHKTFPGFWPKIKN